MDNIQRQNRFIAYYMGGTKHAERAKNDEERLKIRGVETQIPLISQPICEHCERLCYWDQERGIFGQVVPLGVCVECGGITRKPLTYGEYLAAGYDIPPYLSGKEKEDSLLDRNILNMLFNKEGSDGLK